MSFTQPYNGKPAKEGIFSAMTYKNDLCNIVSGNVAGPDHRGRISG